MRLVHWNPWGELNGLHRDLDRFFTLSTGVSSRARTTNHSARPISLATDVHENDDGYTLTIDLPGVKFDDIGIELHEGLLTVSGERKQTAADNVDGDGVQGYRRTERSFGSFRRVFRLPKYVDEANIDATMADGVLTLALPKIAAAQPRKIVINA